jgi:hypothetical protein
MLIGLPSIVALTLYLATLTVVVPGSLSGAGWVLRAPRLAIAVWQALSAAWLVSLVLLGMTLAQRMLERWAWPQGQPGVTSRDLVLATVGLALVSAVIGRGGYVVARELIATRRRRRSHLSALRLAGTEDPALRATILDSDVPAVYSLPIPRRRGMIVISDGARCVLSDEQLGAVVAHERGHLRHHHHRSIVIAGALALAFPRVPLLRRARQEIEILIEMAADDHSRREHPSGLLASALLALAEGRTPEHALGAAGHTVTTRLRRLLASNAPLNRPARLATITSAASAITLPAALSCTTVFTAVAVVVGRLSS